MSISASCSIQQNWHKIEINIFVPSKTWKTKSNRKYNSQLLQYTKFRLFQSNVHSYPCSSSFTDISYLCLTTVSSLPLHEDALRCIPEILVLPHVNERIGETVHVYGHHGEMVEYTLETDRKTQVKQKEKHLVPDPAQDETQSH